jgi:IMP dehydrogenase
MADPVITFDDILLIPQYSEIETRESIDIGSSLKHYNLTLPIIAANMDSVCEADMAIAMFRAGGLGVIHRYMTFAQQIDHVKTVANSARYYTSPCGECPIAAAVGIKNGVEEHAAELVEAGANIIVIDVAHGHHKQVAETVRKVKDLKLTSVHNTEVEIIAGNIATVDGALFLFDAGADTVKVGVGSGSICSTRLVTGHGIPQFAALRAISNILHRFDGHMIADGGIRTSGDIVKALAAGASAVMLGSMLAGTDEAPGEIIRDHNSVSKIYRGMASSDAQKEFYGNYPKAPEGVTTTVPYKGSVNGLLLRLEGGIKSGLSYSGVSSVKELREKAQFITISTASILESRTIEPQKR